jgi:hypothetical protein
MKNNLKYFFSCFYFVNSFLFAILPTSVENTMTNKIMNLCDVYSYIIYLDKLKVFRDKKTKKNAFYFVLLLSCIIFASR